MTKSDDLFNKIKNIGDKIDNICINNSDNCVGLQKLNSRFNIFSKILLGFVSILIIISTFTHSELSAFKEQVNNYNNDSILETSKRFNEIDRLKSDVQIYGESFDKVEKLVIKLDTIIQNLEKKNDNR